MIITALKQHRSRLLYKPRLINTNMKRSRTTKGLTQAATAEPRPGAKSIINVVVAFITAIHIMPTEVSWNQEMTNLLIEKSPTKSLKDERHGDICLEL